MLTKVKADRTVRYGGETYPPGKEFDIPREDYEQHKGILTIIGDENQPFAGSVKQDGGMTWETYLTRLSVSRLKEIAKKNNVQGYEKMKKAELVAALEALEDDANGGPGNA